MREKEVYENEIKEDIKLPKLISYEEILYTPQRLKDINKSEGEKLDNALNKLTSTSDDLPQGAINLYDDQDASYRARTGLTASGFVQKVIQGSNLSGSPTIGLNVTNVYMGYYNGYTWPVYIKNDGKFMFQGDSGNYITWDGSVLNIRGRLNADDISAGTLTGRTVQTGWSGQRVVLESGSAGLIRFYSSSYETATLYGYGTDLMISTSQSSGRIFLNVGSSGAIAFAVGGTIKSYFDAVGDLHIGSGNAVLNNSNYTAQLSVNKNFVPASDNYYTLGSSGLRWSDLRAITATFSGNITINSLNLSSSNQAILVNNTTFMNFIDQYSYGQIIFQRGSAGCDLLPYGDNYGQIGYDSRRWSRIRAINIVSGDLGFENDFKITEEGETGLAFLNQKNEKVAILDDKGNIYIKGKIYENNNL
jgi:hypothetical protein